MHCRALSKFCHTRIQGSCALIQPGFRRQNSECRDRQLVTHRIGSSLRDRPLQRLRFLSSRDVFLDSFLGISPIRDCYFASLQNRPAIIENGYMPGRGFQLLFIACHICPKCLHQIQFLAERKLRKGKISRIHPASFSQTNAPVQP